MLPVGSQTLNDWFKNAGGSHKPIRRLTSHPVLPLADEIKGTVLQEAYAREIMSFQVGKSFSGR